MFVRVTGCSSGSVSATWAYGSKRSMRLRDVSMMSIVTWHSSTSAAGLLCSESRLARGIAEGYWPMR